MADILYFPQELLDLQEELKHNKALQAILAQLPANRDLSDTISEICAFCGIQVDGWYDQSKLIELAKDCTEVLRAVREKEVIVLQ